MSLSALVTACALLLSGCSNSGETWAKEACTHVQRSLALFEKAQTDPDGPGAATERSQAKAQLQKALPDAARANSANPQWNPLMTTLEASATITERNLVTALRAQCNETTQTASTTTIPGG